MAKNRTEAWRIEVEYDPSLLLDATRQQIEEALRKLGLTLQARCVLLANPDVLHVEFERFTPRGWEPATPEDTDGVT